LPFAAIEEKLVADWDHAAPAAIQAVNRLALQEVLAEAASLTDVEKGVAAVEDVMLVMALKRVNLLPL
jgi:hypothetical protein